MLLLLLLFTSTITSIINCLGVCKGSIVIVIVVVVVVVVDINHQPSPASSIAWVSARARLLNVSTTRLLP